jgi:hypothetical protein
MSTAPALFPYWLGQYPPPLPYGSFSSLASQPVTGANTTTVLTYTTTDYSSQITFSGSRITPQASGVYRVLSSVQFDTTSGGTQRVTYWYRKNGTNIANTASTFTIANNGENVGTVEILVALNAGDYIELVMISPDANMTASYTAPSGVAPNNIPAIPSIITVIQKLA